MPDFLEQGEIYFAYRPRVDYEHAQDLDDVQRMFVVLRPQDQNRYRMVVLARKHMPEPSERGTQRFWAFVEEVANGKDEIRRALAGEKRHTRTRGQRNQPEARPAGEGVYALVGHGDHTHLCYILELPEHRDQVQTQLNIEPEADYVVSVKNPEQPSPPEAGLGENWQAEFPKRLQQAFDSRRFIGLQSTEFLEYAGAELLFVSAGQDLSRELEIELDPDHEQQHTADVFNDLKLQRDRHTVRPLVEGKWQ